MELNLKVDSHDAANLWSQAGKEEEEYNAPERYR